MVVLVAAPALVTAAAGSALIDNRFTKLKAVPVADPLGTTVNSTSTNAPVALLITLVRPSNVSRDSCCMVTVALADAADNADGASILVFMKVPLVVDDAEAVFDITVAAISTRLPFADPEATMLAAAAVKDAVTRPDVTLAVPVAEPVCEVFDIMLLLPVAKTPPDAVPDCVVIEASIRSPVASVDAAATNTYGFNNNSGNPPLVLAPAVTAGEADVRLMFAADPEAFAAPVEVPAGDSALSSVKTGVAVEPPVAAPTDVLVVIWLLFAVVLAPALAEPSVALAPISPSHDANDVRLTLPPRALIATFTRLALMVTP